MKKIVYYVATSIDGFISGVNEDISGFVGEGNGVDKYLNDLKDYNTVIMGRRTYEFGYRFGLKPGALAYPHMEHFIFSNTLSFESQDPKLHVVKRDIDEIVKIRDRSETDVYLCGGGVFAGWLLDHQLIDMVKVKINPLILGQGASIFGDSTQSYRMNLMESDCFDGGLMINTYRVQY